jgi:7-cyano-7-deazaguanine reductase
MAARSYQGIANFDICEPVGGARVLPTGLRAYDGVVAITKLGRADAEADRNIETFPITDSSQEVTIDCREFTCRCPITGQPDWATIRIDYRPGSLGVETKSLKLYLETYRDEGIFHEHLATKIRDDLVAALQPRFLKVTVDFNVRGGIALAASSTYQL